jgi:hypothetical protein
MGFTEMTSVAWPDPSDDETFYRLQHAELRGWITEAVLLLPAQERLTFTIYYYERLTTEEINCCWAIPNLAFLSFTRALRIERIVQHLSSRHGDTIQ